MVGRRQVDADSSSLDTQHWKEYERGPSAHEPSGSQDARQRTEDDRLLARLIELFDDRVPLRDAQTAVKAKVLVAGTVETRLDDIEEGLQETSSCVRGRRTLETQAKTRDAP